LEKLYYVATNEVKEEIKAHGTFYEGTDLKKMFLFIVQEITEILNQ
jgi:uncharacterized protein YqgV (UPF0045/DUF77 family)